MTADFLKRYNWSSASQTPITPDWSPRRFTRLVKEDGVCAVLIQGPIPAIPGHDLESFVTISNHLRSAGFSAPEIYAADLEHQLLLVKDFGSTPIDTPTIEKEGYETAVDVLEKFRGADINAIDLTSYKDGYIYKKLSLFSDDPIWMDVWDVVENSLPPCPHIFSHMDYKAGNLHWIPERDGIKRIGILDFQAAQKAPFVYDIVNLLEDARRDIAPDLKQSLKMRFRRDLPKDWIPVFDAWYPVMAAQFHLRVLGQIRKNPNIEAGIIPRLNRYLDGELSHASLAPIKNWLKNADILDLNVA